MGLEKDLPPGERRVACLRRFIEHLASSGLSPKSIRRHVDNLWLTATDARILNTARGEIRDQCLDIEKAKRLLELDAPAHPRPGIGKDRARLPELLQDRKV